MQIPDVKLMNGTTIPQLGLGVYQIDDEKDVKLAIATALESGYRSIDTAAAYGNEAGVGAAIAEAGVARKELFVTTKLWNKNQGYESAHRAFDESLEKLGMEYVDLYLIHWPTDKQHICDSWKAFQEIYASGRARSIGVSNFQPMHLDVLLEYADTTPMINQIEIHPYNQQQAARKYCQAKDIVVESWSPLFQGGELLDDNIITTIAHTHRKSAAQVVLRWHIQHGLVVIPKSVTPERIRENIDIFDFELRDEEMSMIDTLDRDQHVFEYDQRPLS